MTQAEKHTAEVLGRQEALKRHLADVKARNPKTTFERQWEMARKEKPHLFTPDEQAEPVPDTAGEDVVQPQRDWNSLAGPNPPVDRAAKLRVRASHAGGQLIEHKMAVVRQRIKDMQHANPKLRFQAAWDSLRATHPHLFDEETGRGKVSEANSVVAPEAFSRALGLPVTVKASQPEPEIHTVSVIGGFSIWD